MNIFRNANVQVQKFSSGIKDLNGYNSVSNAAASKEFLERNALQEQSIAIESTVELKEKLNKTQKQIENVAKRGLMESQIVSRMNLVSQEGKTLLFKDILFEMYNKSLFLDDSFKTEKQDNIRFLTDSYIDENGGFKMLENAIAATGSPLLKNIKALCENVTKHVCQRKMKEAVDGNDIELLNFELDDEENNDFNYEKQKLGIDELSELVKQKVLVVIQDEKARQVKEEELYADLEDELANNNEVKTESAVKEALKNLAIKQNPVEETTLFNALLRHSYKELLENTPVLQNNSDDNDDSQLDKVNTTVEDIKDDEYQDTTEDDITKNETSSEEEDEELEDEECDVDMDMALAEALSKYTLMELAYTISLEQYPYNTIKKITQSLIK